LCCGSHPLLRNFELCEWAEDFSHRWVLAFLEYRGSDGYDVRSVGMRPWSSQRDVAAFMRACEPLLRYAGEFYENEDAANA
jgi:hypothetical protein